MNYDFVNITAAYLAEGIEQGYKKGLKDTVAKIKKLKFTKKKPDFLKIDYTLTDEEAIKNFKREAFEVAGVGNYEMEEKLKKLAVEVQEKGESFAYFEERARKIMLEYIPMPEQLPSAWLKTNLDTAINSSYSAAQYNRISDPDIKDSYPAWQYNTLADDHVRPEHEVLHELVFANDDPFWNYGYPPNDWNCRCFVIPLSKDEAAALGVVDKDRTAEEEKKYLNNVAEDFRRNPALDKSIYDKWLDMKFADMPEDIADEIKQKAKEFAE